MTPPVLPGLVPLRPLGGGPIFAVWECRPADDAYPLAVKLPRPEWADNIAAVTLLRREARAARLVRHPRLTKLVRSHLDDPPYFVVTEFVPGVNLNDRLTHVGRLGTRSAVWAARQVADGLAALHAAGLAHGDVKPGNIRLRPTGEAVLLDAGFSHRPGENRRLTAAGFVVGSPAYLAPEACDGSHEGGPPADLFALGVTLFECLTGGHPFPPAATPADLVRARRSADPADVRDACPTCPEVVADVLRRLLARDPADRPTAAGLVRQLVRTEVGLLRAAGGRGR